MFSVFGQETPTSDPYGVKTITDQVPLLIVGIFIGFLFIKEVIVSGLTYRKKEKENEELKAELTLLRRNMEEKLLPAIIKAGDVTDKAILIMEENIRLLERSTKALENSGR